MNQPTPPIMRKSKILAMALATGLVIGVVGSTAKSLVNSYSNQGATNVDQALLQMQETVRSIQSTTFAATTTHNRETASAKVIEPWVLEHQRAAATLEVTQIDFRLHRLRNDIIPELDRLEREINPATKDWLPNGQPASASSLSVDGSRLNQMRIIDGLRRDLTEKIASLERQRATLR